MRAQALLVSVGLHVVFVLALWEGPARAPSTVPAPPEVTLVFKQVEGRRSTPRPAVASGGGGLPKRPVRPVQRSAGPQRLISRPTPPTTTPAAPPSTSESAPVTTSAGPISAAAAFGRAGDGPQGPTGTGPGGGSGGRPGGRDAALTSLTPARLLALPEVDYPPRALAEELEGVVRLWVTLDERGQVVTVEVRSEPGLGLGDAAREALSRARFEPARRGAEPVSSAFEYVYRFELR